MQSQALDSITDAFNKNSRKDKKAIKDLETTIVTDVKANSTVLPPGVVREAAMRSGLLKGYLNSTTVTGTARLLKSFYDQNGYVLCEVRGRDRSEGDRHGAKHI